METILGVILGAIIIVGALAWSARHPSPRRPRSEPWHGYDATFSGGEHSSDHFTDHGGGASDGGSFGF
jgi:hypothetical protein